MFAQQTSNIPIAIDNWIVLNPAFVPMDYAENDYNLQLGVVHQQQFTGFKEAPRTESLFSNYFFPDYRVSSGFLLSNDQTGRISTVTAAGHFAYRIEWGHRRSKQLLNVGIRAGASILQHNLSNLRLQDEEDVLVFLENQRKISPNVVFGMHYAFQNKWYVGLVLPQLLPSKIHFNNYQFRYTKQVYLNVGANLITGDKESYFQPSLWFRYLPNAPLNVDALIQYNIKDVFYVGLGMNNQKSMNFQVGFIFSENKSGFMPQGKLKIGCAYQTPTATYLTGLGNAFEIQVNYMLER